jgi:threonine-phosphate decarboxylase
MTPLHGGGLDRVSRETGIPVERILDFSANVNPFGLPERARERLAREARNTRWLTQYPDPEAMELRLAIAKRLGLPIESIVVGAGADALIHAAVRTLEPRRAIIPIPAFSEYERACQAYGCAIERVDLTADFSSSQPEDLVILNNPHNPTGALVSRVEMLDRVRLIRGAGAKVLLDEAFIDYAPDAAVTREAACDTGVIAARSLTKFFGCPGLRVGYAVAAPAMVRLLAAQLPAWPVTTLALRVLADALGDDDYIRTTLETNRQARMALVAALGQLGCRVFPPSANFILFEVPNAFRAPEIRQKLIREHAILVRDCDSFEGLEPGRYLRIAVRQESENQRLTDALAAVLGRKTCRQHT